MNRWACASGAGTEQSSHRMRGGRIAADDRLAYHPDLDPTDIDVSVTNGVGPLRGTRIATNACRPPNERRYDVPERETLERARRDARAGKSPSTQAGEFVREEIHHVREGKHGARSTKQAIAIGLSKARRAGVKLRVPSKGRTSAETRRKAAQDVAKGRKRAKKRPSARRSAAIKRALRREGRAAASKRALARQARSAARRRSGAQRSAAARRAARTKGPAARSAAATKAARTRARAG